jgi:hypothetical protein
MSIATNNVSRKRVKQKLVQIYGSTCFYCQKHFQPEELTFDHYIPRALLRGLKNNLRLSCKRCNTAKGHLLPEMFLKRLDKQMNSKKGYVLNKLIRILLPKFLFAYYRRHLNKKGYLEKFCAWCGYSYTHGDYLQRGSDRWNDGTSTICRPLCNEAKQMGISFGDK